MWITEEDQLTMPSQEELAWLEDSRAALQNQKRKRINETIEQGNNIMQADSKSD